MPKINLNTTWIVVYESQLPPLLDTFNHPIGGAVGPFTTQTDAIKWADKNIPGDCDPIILVAPEEFQGVIH